MKAFKVIAVLLVLAIAAGVLACPIVNDMTAKDIEKELNAIPVPANSSYIKSVSASGKITTGATVMQYYGAVLIQSTQTEYELKQYFKEKDPTAVLISQQEGRTQLANISKDLRFGEYDENSTKSVYYVLYKWDSGTSPFNTLDYRVMFG